MNIFPIHIPTGNDTEVQYNNGGIFGGDSAFTWDDGAAKAMTIVGGAIIGLNSTIFQPTADQTTFFQVKNAAGDTIFRMDSTNQDAYFFEDVTSGENPRLYFSGWDTGGGGSVRTGSIGVDVDGNLGFYPPTDQGIRFYYAGNPIMAMGVGGAHNRIYNDSKLNFGDQAEDSAFVWDSSDNVNNFKLGLGVNSTNRRGIFSIMQYEDLGNANRDVTTLFLDPHLRIYSADNTQAADYLEFFHDQTDANILWGNGGLVLGYTATPYAILWNSTHEDADGGRESRINFKGEQSGGEETTLARIEVSHDGAADDEKGKVVISTNAAADTDTPTTALTIDSEQAIITVKNKITPIGGIAILLTNQTGANTVAGQLVKSDTATDDAVILTAAGDVECFGVFLESGIADGSEAWVVVAGIADVALDDNVAAVHGNWMATGVAAGYARTSASPAAAPNHFEEIGHCIESVAAGGGGTHILARCVLHFN